MEANTEAIIKLAWARLLGLPDDALIQPAPRITRADDSMIMYVSLWQHRVLIGPQWLLDIASTFTDDDLRNGSLLLSLGVNHAGRLLGEAILAFTDCYVEHDGLTAAVVTDDPDAIAELERSCPPDDVAEVGLSVMSQQFVTLDELDQTTAGAGYAEWQGILAQLGVLTPPPLRRSGNATLAGAIATNDALDAGLVPQWRFRRDHRASLALSRRLGYRPVGTQTTVLLNA